MDLSRGFDSANDFLWSATRFAGIPEARLKGEVCFVSFGAACGIGGRGGCKEEI